MEGIMESIAIIQGSIAIEGIILDSQISLCFAHSRELAKK